MSERRRIAWLAILCCGPIVVASGCGVFGSDAPQETRVDVGADAMSDATSSDGSSDSSDGGPSPPCKDCGFTAIAPVIAHPYRIAAANGSIYWSDFTQDVWTCAPDACIPQPLGGDGGTTLKSLIGATSDAVGVIDTTCSSTNDGVGREYLYLRSSGTVTRRGVPCPAFVSAHDDHLYLTNSGTLGLPGGKAWSITRCEPTGACTDLVGSALPSGFGFVRYAVATDTKLIGATDDGLVVQWNNVVDAGGPISKEMVGTDFRDLATDGIHVFWRTGLGIGGCDLGRCTATAHVIANDSTAQLLVADDTGLYWTSKGSGPGDGKVMWLGPGAMIAVPVVTGQISPLGIALDSTYVYWANESDATGDIKKGSILRRNKPR